MSQSVTRLKQLLFDHETHELESLATRLEALSKTHETSHAKLRGDVDAMHARVGDTERLTQTVVEIIDEALRRAEVQKHTALSLSIAPLVVTTIKAELKNSQEEMVEALYPITGRLVKAYVASAIKDLTAEMNRRLEQNPVMLRLQSLTTGRSVGELALAATQDFKVLELFLIRRGSGDLVAHWPQEASGRDHMMSGVLAAINAFANEAFAADEASMRQIDLGEETIYLRGSQLYLLAAKCSGSAPRDLEQSLDEAFLATIEKTLDAAPSGRGSAELIRELGADITRRVDASKSQAAPRSLRPLKILATLILLPLLAWFGWSAYERYADNRTRAAARAVVGEIAEMTGYPALLEAQSAGSALRVSGLAPSQAIKTKVITDLTRALPDVAIDDKLTVVPGSDIAIPDPEPKFEEVRQAVRSLQSVTERAAIARTTARAGKRLEQARSGLLSAAAGWPLDQTIKRKEAADLAAAFQALSQDTSALALTLTDSTTQPPSAPDLAQRLDELTQALAAHAQTLNSLAGLKHEQTPPVRSSDPALAAETLAAEAERSAAVASIIAVASTLKPIEVTIEKTLPAPPPPAPDARQQLETYAARHAVFFSNGTEFRSPELAKQTLDELAAHMRAANSLVRIIGYTDEAGTVPGNTTLAQQRADKVRDELLARGVPATQLSAVGRRDSLELSTAQGATSPNRRVAFEVGYEGEVAP